VSCLSLKALIQTQISDLFEFDEVTASFLIRLDGIILFSNLPKRAEVSVINSIEWIQDTTVTMAREIQMGNLKKLIFEMRDFNVVFHQAGPNTMLVCITKININFGLMLIEIARRARIIAREDKKFK